MYRRAFPWVAVSACVSLVLNASVAFAWDVDAPIDTPLEPPLSEPLPLPPVVSPVNYPAFALGVSPRHEMPAPPEGSPFPAFDQPLDTMSPTVTPVLDETTAMPTLRLKKDTPGYVTINSQGKVSTGNYNGDCLTRDCKTQSLGIEGADAVVGTTTDGTRIIPTN